MKYRIELLSTAGAACFVVLGWAIWLLVTEPLAHLFHSQAETIFAAIILLQICLSIVAGVVISAWDTSEDEPRPHHHFHFRELFHH